MTELTSALPNAPRTISPSASRRRDSEGSKLAMRRRRNVPVSARVSRPWPDLPPQPRRPTPGPQPETRWPQAPARRDSHTSTRPQARSRTPATPVRGCCSECCWLPARGAGDDIREKNQDERRDSIGGGPVPTGADAKIDRNVLPRIPGAIDTPTGGAQAWFGRPFERVSYLSCARVTLSCTPS